MIETLGRPIRALERALGRIAPAPEAPLPPLNPDVAQPLMAIAADVHGFLVPRWKAEHQKHGSFVSTPSTGMCIKSSLFLVEILTQQNIEGKYRFGDQKNAQGFGRGRRRHSHGWVESGGIIVDITADQFGAAPIVVTPVEDPRYRPDPNERPVCAAITDVTEAWVREWQEQRPREMLRVLRDSGTGLSSSPPPRPMLRPPV